MSFHKAIASASMRFAEPERPTSWAPSNRPDGSSAISLIVIGCVPGK